MILGCLLAFLMQFFESLQLAWWDVFTGLVRTSALRTSSGLSKAPHLLLIVGGLLPPGYIFVGRHHHGGPIYGSADTVHASMMHSPVDAAAPGHAEDQ